MHIFLLLLSIFANIDAKPAGWKLAREINGIQVWQLIENSHITGVFQSKKTKNKIDWSNQESLFKKIVTAHTSKKAKSRRWPLVINGKINLPFGNFSIGRSAFQRAIDDIT